jgi:hypothetical protein
MPVWNAARFFIAVAFLFTLTPHDAKALSSASARVTVDWSSLTVDAPTGSSFGDLLSFSESETNVFSGAGDPGTTNPSSGATSDSSNDWGNTSFDASQSGASGGGATTSGQLSVSGDVSASGENNAADGGGHVIREGILTVGSDGFVSISFNYEMELVLSTSLTGETAFGLTQVQAAFVPSGVSARSIGPKTVKSGNSFSDTNNGTYSFSDEFQAGDTIGFQVDIIAFAQAFSVLNPPDDDDVPEPSTLLLMSIGLPLLRRRWKNSNA